MSAASPSSSRSSTASPSSSISTSVTSSISSSSSPATTSATTPWGERQRHTQVDEKTKGDWVAVQKKTFTRWANAHLRRRGQVEINDLFADTSDGIRLMQLLEVIGGDSIYSLCKRKYNPAPKFRIHKLENCNLIFEYLRKKELQLTNIGSTDIVDSNEKLILGLMWTIILRFAVAENGKQGLLLWLQRSTAGYPGVHVHNFDLSWTDGRAFLALIHKYRPDVLPADAVSWLKKEGGKEDAKQQVALAFQLARDELEIDALLDPEDVVDTAKPDEKSMIAYLSQFFNKFASLTRKQALVESIVKAVGVARKHDTLLSDYEQESQELKTWLQARTRRWEALGGMGRTTEDVKAQLDALHVYRREEKVQQKAKLLRLTSVLGQLRGSQRNHNRPLYAPLPGMGDKDLWEEDWPALEAAEGRYEKACIEKYAGFSVIDFALTKVQNKLSKLEPWLESRTSYFTTALPRPPVKGSDGGEDENGECKSALAVSISSLEQRLSSHAAFESQVDVYEALLSESRRLLSGELSEEHAGVGLTKARVAVAAETMANLKDKAKDFKVGVEARLQLEKKLEHAANRYVTLAEKVGFVVDEVEEAMAEPLLGNNVEEVEALESRFSTVSATFQNLSPVMKELAELSALLIEHGRADRVGEERQTTAPAVLLATHVRVVEEVSKHTTALAQAREETSRKVQAREAFATAARALNAFVQRLTEKSNLGGRRSSLQPEEVKNELKSLQAIYDGEGKTLMASVESASAEQEAAGVVANGFVTDTVYSLRKAYEDLGKLLEAQITDCLTAEAALISQTAESNEQWKEITRVFHALEEEKRGVLTAKAFKEGLQALGVLLEDSEADVQFRKVGGKEKVNGMTLAEFGSVVTAALTAGSSSDDIMAAFKAISLSETEMEEGKEGLISGEVIKASFAGHGDIAEYIEAHMPQKGTTVVKRRRTRTRGAEWEEGKTGESQKEGEEKGEKEELEVPMFEYASFVHHIFAR